MRNTYAAFHIRFTLPLALVCFVAAIIVAPMSAMLVPLGLCAVVILFTFPWDNWAVRRGVWDFPDDRILKRMSYLPVEEVFFFAIQTIQVGFLTIASLSWFGPFPVAEAHFDGYVPIRIGIVGVVWAALIVGTSRLYKQRPSWTYAWHLGVWFVPLIVLQWTFAFSLLSDRLLPILFSTAVIGSLLVLADVWAVKRGIWFFDHKQTLGRTVATVLPVEEVAFFYITSLLVSQSVVLFLPTWAR